MNKAKLNFLFISFLLCLTSPLFSADEQSFTEYLFESDQLRQRPAQTLQELDFKNFESEYRLNVGGDLFEQVLRFLFPISGREKRTMFMPLPYWGPKKPQYKKFDWKKYETAHFEFFVYPEAEGSVMRVSTYLEEDYERNNRIFGVQSRFTKKIPIIVYQTRGHFEQTFIVSGVVPEGLGGVTEIFSWKRATFPFEGELEKFEHVAKHEGTHIYQIAKEVKKLPLWFIEGNAETNSIYWDADAEMVIRDAFLNGFFFHIKDLWQIQGTWLMYKQGNFITNLIWREYGEEGLRKIYDRANEKGFEENLKESLNLKIEDLDLKVQAELSKRYSQELKRKDLTDQSHKLEEGRVLLHAKDSFYLSGGANGPRTAIYINYVDKLGKIYKHRVVSDREFQTESLGYFKKGAWMDSTRIVYAAKKAAQDELRIVPYKFDAKSKKFRLSKPSHYSWPHIDTIESPVLVGDSEIVFIGYHQGHSNIYRHNIKSKKFEQLTQDGKHYSGLDYSAVKNQIVFSREEGRVENRIYYNRDLFVMDLTSLQTTALTQTPRTKEVEPRFSPDGSYIVFVSSDLDENLTQDLYLYQTANKSIRRISKMKINAKNPQWGPELSIYYNSYTRLRPNIYQTEFPRAPDTLRVNLPQNPNQFFKVNDTALSVPEAALKLVAPVKSSHTFTHGADDYHSKDFATIGHTVILKAKRGADKKLQEQTAYRYFSWSQEGYSSLDSEALATNYLNPATRRSLEELLDGRPIIDVWTHPDSDIALLLVNNRLALNYLKYKKRSEVAFVVANLKLKTFQELQNNLVDDVKPIIQWVSFMGDDQFLVALSEKKEGPYRLLVMNLNGKKNVELDREIPRFRVSHDRSRMVWYREGELFEWKKSSGSATRVTLKQRGSIQSFDYDRDGSLIVFLKNKKEWLVSEINSSGAEKTYTITHDDKLTLLAAVIDDESGNIVIRATQDERGKSEELFLWTKQDQSIYNLSSQGEGFKYTQLQFKKGYLFFTERRYPYNPPKEWVWKNKIRDSLEPLSEAKELLSASWILRGDHKLSWVNFKEPHVELIARDNAGQTYAQGKIYYSAPDNDNFKLFAFDTLTKKYSTPVTCKSQCVEPLAHGSKLYWIEREPNSWALRQAMLDQLESSSVIGHPDYDFSAPAVSAANSVVVSGEVKVKTDDTGLVLKHDEKQKSLFLPQPFKNEFKLESLSAAAAFDGSNVRFFASGFLDNIFSDRGMFVDSFFLGSARFATIGYADLRYGQSYNFFYNSRDGLVNYGLGFSKTYLLDRFRELSLYSNLEVQDYGAATPETINFITPKEEFKNFYIAKVGTAFGYDTTSWDYHGPVRGSRFFFKAEAGADVGHKNLSNVDVNIDYRLYHQILPKFGFAHRIVAGTSQGELPNVFLSGGNISFRGVGFDDLQGQNYWVFSEDLRVPVFDFLGAKFFDPVDQFLGIFTRFFDIRSGLYTDIGQTWFNDKNNELLYSVGYFVNIPTLLGVNFRFNQGLAGKKNIGIWLGSNW